MNKIIARCGMAETVRERQDGMGTAEQTVRWEIVGTGTRHLTAGTETNDRADREIAGGNETSHRFLFPYRTVPVPTFTV